MCKVLLTVKKRCRDLLSSIMPSIATTIDPSGPLSARPGPLGFVCACVCAYVRACVHKLVDLKAAIFDAVWIFLYVPDRHKCCIAHAVKRRGKS